MEANFTKAKAKLLRLGVHDSSRLEWMAELPFSRDKNPEEFDLELTAEVPAHIWTAHDHWERLQLLARLSSPNDEQLPANVLPMGTVDELRRAALAAARRAKETQSHIERLIFEASSLLIATPNPALADEILALFHRGLQSLREMRDSLGTPRATESGAVTRERALAEEFLSNYAIELVSRVEKAVAGPLLGPRHRHQEYETDASRIRAALASELLEEFSWRRSRGLAIPTDRGPWDLEKYVSRVSGLRKHFQGLLFLQVETELADSRYRPLFGAVAAGFGALAAFPLLLFFTGGYGVAGLSVGLSGAAILVAVTYGVRERIKDGVRSWLARRLRENVGGRLTKMTTMRRHSAEPAELVRVRESFYSTMEQRSDPLHPDLGESLSVVRLRYHMRGTVHRDDAPADRGSERVKLVFRYDLSPLFTRLDDPFKHVPILTEDGSSVRFVDAARCYRIPVRLALRHRGETQFESGTIVTHKLGLERLERPLPDEPIDEPSPLFAAGGSGAFSSVASAMMRRR